jgi:hypothetical protein
MNRIEASLILKTVRFKVAMASARSTPSPRKSYGSMYMYKQEVKGQGQSIAS